MQNDIVCHEIVRIPSYWSNIFSTQIFQELLIAPRVAPLPELAKQPHGSVAAGIPALKEIGFRGVEHTVPVVAAAFASPKGGGPEVTLYRTQTQPDLLRNGRGRPALVVQSPDLLMQRLPACLPLCRALLHRQGDGVGWHGHGYRPIGQRHGLLAQRLIDGVRGQTSPRHPLPQWGVKPTVCGRLPPSVGEVYPCLLLYAMLPYSQLS